MSSSSAACAIASSEPTLAEGYLPIAEIRYQHIIADPVRRRGAADAGATAPPARRFIALEAFASTDPALAEHGVVFVKFSLAQGANGIVAVDVDDKTPLKFADGKLTDEKGEVVAHRRRQLEMGAPAAQSRGSRRRIVATLAIATKPLAAAQPNALQIDYAAQRTACVDTWRKILGGGDEASRRPSRS